MPARGGVGVVLIALCCLGVQARSQEQEDTLRLRDAFSGSLELALDLAGNDRDRDIELSQILRLTAKPPARPKLRIVSSLWVIEDLDGSESPTSSLRTLTDTDGEAVDPRLLTLYLERKNDRGNSVLRLGRQRIPDGVVWNRIDGIYYRAQGPMWSGYGFGGSRASVYDYAINELVGGGGAAVRLPTRTHARLDVFFGEENDQRNLLNETDSFLTSISVTQALGTRHYLDSRVTWHKTDLDQMWISARGVFKKPEIVYNLTYQSKRSVRSQRIQDITDFVTVVGALNDYRDLSALLALPISKHVTVGVQGQFHDAVDSSVTTGNRDYDRYGVTLDFIDLRNRYDIALAADRWDTEGGEHQETFTGSVTRNWTRRKLTAGVDFDQFQDRILVVDPVFLTPIQIESRQDIYTYFIDLRHELDDDRGFRVRASFEEDDGPDSPHWWVRAAYTMRF